MNELGRSYACGSCGGAVLVFNAGAGSLSCCATPMSVRGSAATAQTGAAERRDPVGVRFRCATCGTAVLCTVAPAGDVRCCAMPMDRQSVAALPPVG